MTAAAQNTIHSDFMTYDEYPQGGLKGILGSRRFVMA